jgi:hypothetical protein
MSDDTVEFEELVVREPAELCGVRPAVEQPVDFVQSEAAGAREANDAQSEEHVFRVLPTPVEAPGSRKQADSFVVSNGRRAQTGSSRDFSNQYHGAIVP